MAAKNCHICDKELKKGDRIFTTSEGVVIRKGIHGEDDQSEPLVVCEKCGKELNGAVETLKRFKESEK